MDKNEVMDKVAEVINQVQETGGRTISEVRPDTCPLIDVEGFDSLSSVEATVILSESLGVNLPDSVFLPAERDRNLSISEIANNICSIMEMEASGR